MSESNCPCHKTQWHRILLKSYTSCQSNQLAHDEELLITILYFTDHVSDAGHVVDVRAKLGQCVGKLLSQTRVNTHARQGYQGES